MARDESAREDVLREATALVNRVELGVVHTTGATGSASAVDAQAKNIIVGFRPDGAASFFFGDDSVYQFNAAGELRRAFCDGRLYKAARRRLVSLDRQRGQGAVVLLRRELTGDEQRAFLARMQERLRGLADGLETGAYFVVGQIPADADVLSLVRNWLATHDGSLIATTPGV